MEENTVEGIYRLFHRKLNAVPTTFIGFAIATANNP